MNGWCCSGRLIIIVSTFIAELLSQFIVRLWDDEVSSDDGRDMLTRTPYTDRAWSESSGHAPPTSDRTLKRSPGLQQQLVSRYSQCRERNLRCILGMLSHKSQTRRNVSKPDGVGDVEMFVYKRIGTSTRNDNA